MKLSTLADCEAALQSLLARTDEDAGMDLRGLSQDIRSCAWNGAANQAAAREIAARADAAATERGAGSQPLPIHGSTGTTADGSYRYGGRY